MADSLQRLGLNQLNHKLKVKKGGIEVTNGNISGSITSTGSFGKLDIADNSTLTGDLYVGSNITGSNDISASGTITAANFEIVDSLNVGGHVTASGDVSASGNIYGTGNLDIDGTADFASHITASGNISSSGNIRSSRFEIDGTAHYIDTSLGNMFVVTTGDIAAQPGTGKRLNVEGNINTTGHITASGNISGSGTITIPQIINFEGANGGTKYTFNNISDTTNGATGRNLGFTIATGSNVGGAVINISGSGGNAFVGIGTAYTDAMYQALTVKGNISASGDVDIDGSITSSGLAINGTSDFDGNVNITGDLTAQQYIVSSSVTYLTQSFASGSNIFGDSMDDTHEFSGSLLITGSNHISGTLSVQAEGVYSSSTAIITNNIQNGYPTSNPWGSSLEGSYFNNFDNTTNVSEILRFMSGVLSHSLDVSDSAPNVNTWGGITTTETNLGSTDTVDGYLPQSYDSSNATMKYLVTKNWVSEGGTIFSGISSYHDNGPTYKIDFTSITGSTTTVSSSVDTQLFGLGGLSSGAATRLDVRVVATQSFSDTGSIANPSSSYKFTSQSSFDITLTDFGTSNGVTLAKINTTQPAVIPAAYQDGKFASVGGTDMTGSLTRKYHASLTDFTSVSSSGYYNFHGLKVGLATGSGNFAFHTGSSQNKFWAPIDQISTDIGTNTLGITSVTQSYVSATSRSLSGAPYLIGATYHLSASVHGLFNPMYAASSTLVDDTIGSVGVGSVAATSGVDGLSTSGGTIQTSNAVLSVSSSGTLRSTSAVPTRTDIYQHNAIYTLSGTTGENVNQSGVSDSTFTIGIRGRNRASSRSTLQTMTYFYHSGSTFGQPASSGSMAVYQRSQGYDGGSLTGTTELFSGEDFRIRNTNDVTGFNGKAWFTNFTSSQDHLGTYDLQVKPGYLVNPGGDYRYWYPEDYHSSATYKYYIRRFQTSGTKTSMTVNLNNNTLVNWKAATNNKVACALLFKSSASGSGTNDELSRARIYDPSETTANAISSSIANDNFLNPFSSAIDLYGNTGGSLASGTYTVPMRNSDGMYLDLSLIHI